jgi:hypothetical protein
MFDDKTLAAERIGQASGKLRIVFDEKNANGSFLLAVSELQPE